MAAGGRERTELHATPRAHAIELGGPDGHDVQVEVAEAVAKLLDDPPALLLTTSCSAALDAAATVIGLGPGDEVVVPAFTFPTTAAAFAATGATIRFADVDPRTMNVDPERVLERVGEHTCSVVVMHYAGIGVDLSALGSELTDRGVDLVEDAAHGIFGRADGLALGRHGRFGCLSFHHTKNVSSLEGGALVVNDPADVDAALVAVDKGTNRVEFEQGRTVEYEWVGLGSSWRMHEGAARYLARELATAEQSQARRLAAWGTYVEELADWAGACGVGLPVVPAGRTAPAHLFFLVLPAAADRPGFVAHCAERGVAAVRHYGSLPDSSYGRSIRHADDACPLAADLALRLVRIPLHQHLGDDEVARVVDAVRSWRPS